MQQLRRIIGFLCVLGGLLLAPLPALAGLTAETTAAYQQYIAGLDAQWNAKTQNPFLWIDRDAARGLSVRQGKVVTQQVKSFSVPEGMVQHWIGGVFLPGATLAQVETLQQDYGSYDRIYGPDITRVRVLSHSGNRFLVAYRITKKKVLTAVLDTVQAIDYLPMGDGKLAIRSQSQSVRQVENAGTASEKVLGEGEGTGFLWAMNSYWRMEERDSGVYLECAAITLSRAVPFGMGALINPILQSFAQESLEKTLDETRKGVALRK